MAINQDGSDFTYFSTMRFGTPGRDMYMLLDTGSADTWAMGDSCQSPACRIHNTLGQEDSNTLQITSAPWSMSYGTGQVQGFLANDQLSFANYSVHVSFGLANTASDDFLNYVLDGILGLGRPASDTLGTQTIMETLDEQAGLSQNLVGVHLQRSFDGTRDGQITFGGYDSSKFDNNLSFTKTANDRGWEIPVDDAGFDNKAVGFARGKTAFIDTGTSYILLPPADAKSLHALIPGATNNGEIYLVPCTTTATVYISFSGVKYAISPKDYVGRGNGNVCNSNIIGHQAYGPNQWILGAVFLKNVYSVFDFDHGQIGFGTRNTSPSTTSSSSTSSSSSSSSSTLSSSSSSSSSSSTSSTSSNSQTSDSSTSTSSTSTPDGQSTETTRVAPTNTLASEGGGGSPFSNTGHSDAAKVSIGLFPAFILAFLIGLML